MTRGTVYIRRDLVHTAIEKALCAALTGPGAGAALGQASRATNSLEGAVRGSHALLDDIQSQLDRERKQLSDLMQLWAGAGKLPNR